MKVCGIFSEGEKGDQTDQETNPLDLGIPTPLGIFFWATDSDMDRQVVDPGRGPSIETS